MTGRAVGILVLVGCGGAGASTGSTSDAGTDGGTAVTDAGNADGGMVCNSPVCFTWDPREENVPSPLTPPLERGTVTYETCNGYVVNNESSCPDGFTCSEEPITVEFQESDWTFPVCTSSSGSPYTVVIDLPPAPAMEDPVAVTLVPTLSGATWPGTDVENGAGKLRISNSETGLNQTVLLPTAAGEVVELALEPGTHRVTAQFFASEIDTATFPAISRTGTLIVNASGEAEVPFEAAEASFEVELNDTPLGVLGENESVTVRFRGYHGQFSSASFLAGSAPAGSIVLEPDTYQIEVDFSGPVDGSGLPRAPRAVVADEVQISGDDVSLDLNRTTESINGTVQIDGSDVPMATERGSILFSTPTGYSVLEISLDAAVLASFSGELISGTYQVSYLAEDTALIGVPPMNVLVDDDYTAGDPLDIDLSTIQVSGEVQLNGSVVPDGLPELTAIRFVSGPNQTDFDLPTTGARTYDFLVFDQPYRLEVVGFLSPGYVLAWPIDAEYQPTVTPEVFDVEAHSVTVALQFDGGDPPDATGFDRGSLHFLLLSGPAGTNAFDEALAPWPLAGALTYTGLLPDATWRISHVVDSFDYTGLPNGMVILDRVELDEDYSESFDVALVQVNGEITQGGEPLPDAGEGEDRGTVQLQNGVQSGLFGVVTHSLGASGLATFSAIGYEGPNNVWFTCRHEDDCDARLPDMDFFILFGLGL